MTTGNRSGFPARRKWAGILAAIVLVLVAGGYGFYRVEAKHIRLDKHNELAAIGELKAAEIARWRQERLDDASADAGCPFFRKAVEASLKDSGNPALRDELLQCLKLEQRTEDVADALLLDPDGRILLAAKDDPGPVDAATMWAVAQALEGKQAALSDLFRSPDGKVYLDAVAPVRDADNQPIAVVVLRSDAAKFLYPLIQSWPILSRSAETLLVRKEGEDVLFLNELRHRAGAALSFRTPLTRRDLPGAQAVAGKQGMFRGKDYRGVEVLADLRPVPGSPWFMVAKVDASEILAEVNYRAGVIVVFVVLSILLSAFVVAFLYRQRQVRLYRALHASEREKHKAEELLRATLIGIGDAVIAADERGCVTFTNPVAETLTGWPRAEAQGKPLSQVFHIVNAQTRERCENPVEKVLALGRVVGLANHTLLIARDGTERQIADSGAPIRDAGGGVIGVVVVFRDVTEEYRMHEALRVSHRFLEIANRHTEMIPLLKESVAELRSFTRCAAAGLRMLDAEGNIPYQAYEGFSQRFYESESPLSIKSDQCMCINVIKGTTDPKLSFYTEGGSFYMNGTTRFLATVSEEEKGRTRNACHQAGYESVALVPIRAQGRILGLIHVADPRENMVPLEVVEVLEEAAMQLGMTIERVWAEDETRRLAELLDCAPSSITVHDFDGRFLYANQRTLELHGYSRDEFLALNLHQVDVPESEALIASRMREVGEKGEARFEVAHLRKDGTTVPLEIYARMTTWGDRRVILSVGTDITERKRAEEALRDSETRYRALFEGNADGILAADVETKDFKFANPALCRMLGYTEEELKTMGVGDIHPKESLGRVVSEFDARARGDETLAPSIPCLRKDGTVFHADVNTFRIAFEGRTCNVGLFRDITERKRAEEERKRLQDQLAQAQKMESVGRLAGGVAHDFNNMLQVILMGADMALAEAGPDSPLGSNLLEIKKAGRRSADLTRQLLAFARKQIIAPRVLDLNDTVAGMLRMLGRLIGEDIDLLWKPGHDLPAVKMDPGQIDQILANLVVNARDAIAGVGKVTIETGKAEFDQAYCDTHPGFTPGQYVLLAVSDDGCGMDQETLANIFEPFFTTKESGEGTGLGLATVYGIVKQNNGFINAYSEPGKGTTLRIYLPPHEAKAAGGEKRESLEPATGTETVLLVEDQEALLTLAKKLLERLGYTVLTANAPEKAIRLVEEHAGDIHLVITDVVMPEMSGGDLWRRLNALRPGLKCLFMSGYTANVIAHRAILEEGVHFLQKPFSVEALAAKVREALSA